MTIEEGAPAATVEVGPSAVPPIEAIRARRVVVSVSGGKDSAAACLHLRELGIPHERVFADTGWEHPKTYEYLRGELTRVLGPIHEVRGPRTFPELVRHKGMFPSRTKRFCTQELKVKPLSKFMRAFDDDIVNVVGIRADESRARSNFLEWEYDATFDCDVWRPLLRWAERDVIAIHQRHGLRPNPLYLIGTSRVGCWPCIHARKSELLLMAEKDPARVDEIRELERDVQAAAQRRYAEQGESFESLGYLRPTFFQGPIEDRGMWPIDKMITWSRTSRGGRQLEMLRDEPDGCARWGMCEPQPDEPEPETP